MACADISKVQTLASSKSRNSFAGLDIQLARSVFLVSKSFTLVTLGAAEELYFSEIEQGCCPSVLHYCFMI